MYWSEEITNACVSREEMCIKKEDRKMATRVERNGIEACIGKIKQAIGELETAASAIDTAMNALPESWEGAAYDKARATYEEQYRKLLTQEVPQAVESFRGYIDNCMQTIIDIDNQLAGMG